MPSIFRHFPYCLCIQTQVGNLNLCSMYLPDRWFTLVKHVFFWVPTSHVLPLRKTEKKKKRLLNYIFSVKVSVQISENDFPGGLHKMELLSLENDSGWYSQCDDGFGDRLGTVLPLEVTLSITERVSGSSSDTGSARGCGLGSLISANPLPGRSDVRVLVRNRDLRGT